MSRNARYARPKSKNPLYTPGAILPPKVMLRQEFSRELSARMLAANMTQSDLSRASGIGRDSISGYICGKTLPDPPNAEKLAKALKCQVSDLYSGSVKRAMDSEVPAIDLKVSPGHPDRAWLQINRELSFSVAAKIIELVNSDKSA